MVKKKDERNNILKRNIKIVYNIVSKTHEEEFKAYALLGIWITKNWQRINKIIDIQVK